VIFRAEQLAWADALCWIEFDRVEESLHECVVERLPVAPGGAPVEVA
jgi:hypothetical protein